MKCWSWWGVQRYLVVRKFHVGCWANQETCSCSFINVFGWINLAVSQVLTSICALTRSSHYFFSLTILKEFCLRSCNSSEEKWLWCLSRYLAQNKSRSELSFQNSQTDFECSYLNLALNVHWRVFQKGHFCQCEDNRSSATQPKEVWLTGRYLAL